MPNKKRKKVKRPIKSKFDPRFSWKDATFIEKIKRAEMVLNDHVIKKNGCWGWTGSIAKGYGNLTFEQRPMKAHRVSWMVHHGIIPGKKWVLHACDNTLCTNPEHLFLGTPKDNWDDMVSKGRRIFKKGSECSWAKLTERKVRNIKKLLLKKVSCAHIAKKYKVGKGTIEDIKSGKNWKHVLL